MNDATRKITVSTILEAAPAAPYNEHNLPETARFYELGIDSINMLSILLKLEERLSVDLVQLGDQLQAPVTVQDLFRLVEQLLQLAHNNNQVNNQ